MKNLKVLSNENMKNIKGGNASLVMRWDYQDKDECLAVANRLIDRGAVTGMTRKQIAQEIYAHAKMYYCAEDLHGVIPESVYNYLIFHF